MDGVVVTIDRCTWAETDWMFAAFQAQADVVNTWLRDRTPIAYRDGSITVYFSGCGVGRPDAWRDTVHHNRPRAEILRGTWSFPAVADGRAPP